MMIFHSELLVYQRLFPAIPYVTNIFVPPCSCLLFRHRFRGRQLLHSRFGDAAAGPRLADHEACASHGEIQNKLVNHHKPQQVGEINPHELEYNMI